MRLADAATRLDGPRDALDRELTLRDHLVAVLAEGGRAKPQLGMALRVQELRRQHVRPQLVVLNVEALDPGASLERDAVGTGHEARVEVLEGRTEGGDAHVLDLDPYRRVQLVCLPGAGRHRLLQNAHCFPFFPLIGP